MRRLEVLPLVVLALLLTTALAHDEDLPVEDAQDAVDKSDDVPTIKDDEEIVYHSPQLERQKLPHFLYEHFDDADLFGRQWIKSRATKAESQDMLFDGEWELTQTHSRVVGKCAVELRRSSCVSVIHVFWVQVTAPCCSRARLATTPSAPSCRVRSCSKTSAISYCSTKFSSATARSAEARTSR